MLYEALRKGERPVTKRLYDLYDKRDAHFIEEILQNLWIERKLKEVTNFFLKLVLLNIKLSLPFLSVITYVIQLFWDTEKLLRDIEYAEIQDMQKYIRYQEIIIC